MKNERRRETKKELKIIMGLPGSGKSSIIAKGYSSENPFIIENDKLRKELNFLNSSKDNKSFAKTRDNLVEKIIKTNEPLVILDGVFSSAKNRRKHYNVAKKYGYKVEIIVAAISIDTAISRNSGQRPNGQNVPADVIKNMASNMTRPEIGVDCDCYSVISMEDERFDVNKKIEKLKSINHDSIFHLESIGSHISMTIKNVEKSNYTGFLKEHLLEVAKWHDLEKNNVAINYYIGKMYGGHEKAGWLTYLAQNLPYEEKVQYQKHQKEFLIADAIYEHMQAHDNAVESYIATVFAKIDEESKLYTPLKFEKLKMGRDTVRKYIFSPSFNQMHFYFQVEKEIESSNFSKKEVECIIKDTQKFFNCRSAIFAKNGEKLIHGLEAFFNVGQFDFIKIKEEDSESLKLWKNFYKDLGAPTGKIKKFNKVDGMLVQTANINGIIINSSRGSFSLDGIEYATKEKGISKNIENMINSYLKENPLNLGEVVYFELIGKKTRIVLDYGDELKLIPLLRIHKNGVKDIFNTDIANNFNKSEFIEGEIAVDEKGRYFKVKTDEYFEKHSLLCNPLKGWAILDTLINDNLDDKSFIFSESEMEIFLEVEKEFFELFNIEDKSYLNLKEKGFEKYFTVLKNIKNFSDLEKQYNNDAFHYFLAHPDYLKDELKNEKKKTQMKRKALEAFTPELPKEYNYKYILKGIKEDIMLASFANILEKRANEIKQKQKTD